MGLTSLLLHALEPGTKLSSLDEDWTDKGWCAELSWSKQAQAKHETEKES